MTRSSRAAASASFLDRLSARIPARFAPHPHDVLALAFGLLPAVVVVADKATVPLLLFALVAMLPGAVRAGWRPTPPGRVTGGLFAAAFAWCLAASLWSFHPGEAATTAVRLASLIAGGWLVIDIARRTPSADSRSRRRMGQAAGIGVAAGAVLLCSELLSDHMVKRVLTWDWTPRAVRDPETNRAASLLAILAFVVVPWAWRQPGGRSVAVGTGVAVLAALWVTVSATSQMAFLLGLLFLAGAWLGPAARIGAWLLVGAVSLSALPWLAQLAFDAGLTEASWLPGSAPHRVFIWNHVSEWALEKPLLGWGFDSSSGFPNRGVEPWKDYTSVIPLHPHNAPLQIFLELGAVGLAIAAAVVAETVRRIERTGPAWSPWFGAAAMTAYAIANSGYGIWQTQWIAALLWILCCAVALQRTDTCTPHQ